MGCIFSKIIKDSSNIEVLDFTPPGTEYDYLRPRGTIYIEITNAICQLFVSMSMVGYNNQREQFLLLDRTPIPSPSIRNTSLDSGYDTDF